LNKALILAGGFGTRLQSVVNDVPKPMASVAGRPFLEYVLDHCFANGIAEAILSVGYKSDSIIGHFGESYKGLKLSYAIEQEPLGTGGGIRFASEGLPSTDLLTVLNGDTLFKSDLKALAAFYQNRNADMAMALRRMQRFDRYGLVETSENDRVKSFLEKQSCEEGLINAGVYIFKAGLLQQHFSFGQKFSFEKDFMEHFVSEMLFYGIEQEGYFIDIGIPEDFDKANKDFA